MLIRERRAYPINFSRDIPSKDQNMRLILSATLLSVAIGMGTAWAQAPAPSPTNQDQRKAISKSCTDQATAKGLHGKARRKFRSECKKAGGKPQ
jgi:hypothetical protein